MLPRRPHSELRIRDEARDAADARVRENMGLIESTFRRRFPALYRMAWTVLEDARAVAMWSLCKSARDFKPERGCQFSTLAVRYIENDVTNHLAGMKRRRRIVVVELEPIADGREMDPAVAAVTFEQIHRRTTGNLFGGNGEGGDDV